MAPMILPIALLLSLLLLLPVLTPCRGLVPSGTRRAVCGSLLSGLRLGWSPIRCRASASTLRSEPRLSSPRTLRGSRSSPCADAMSRARALRDSPRCVWFSPVRGLRFGWSPIRCRASAPILRSELRLPSPRTLRGSRPPAGCGCCPFCTHTSPSAAHLR